MFYYVLNSDGRIRQRLSRAPTERQAAALTVVTDERKLEPGGWRYADGKFVRFRRRSSDAPDRQDLQDAAASRSLLKHHITLIEDVHAREAVLQMARSLGLIEEG